MVKGAEHPAAESAAPSVMWAHLHRLPSQVPDDNGCHITAQKHKVILLAHRSCSTFVRAASSPTELPLNTMGGAASAWAALKSCFGFRGRYAVSLIGKSHLLSAVDKEDISTHPCSMRKDSQSLQRQLADRGSC